jgi:hypothetical protein
LGSNPCWRRCESVVFCRSFGRAKRGEARSGVAIYLYSRKKRTGPRARWSVTIVVYPSPPVLPDARRWPGPRADPECAMVLTSGKVRCAPSSPCSRRSGRCAWLRAAVLLSSPALRATADAVSGRDGKAGALTEPESWVRGAAARTTVSRSEFSVTAATGGGNWLTRGARLPVVSRIKTAAHRPG